MEKLQPVIRQIFWVCTGLVVILVVAGWWMAMGNLNAQIEKDKGILNKALSDSKSGRDTPNATFTANAREFNQRDSKSFEQAEKNLHAQQIGFRTFPASIASELQNYSFGSLIEDTPLRYRYGQLYEDHLLEQFKVLNPFIEQDAKGLVSVSVQGVTQEDPSQWARRRPTSSEICSRAQEDLWLIRSVFQSIAATNEGAERITDAPVRELLELYLRGGERMEPGSSSDDGMGGMAGLGGMAGMMMGGGSGMEMSGLAGLDMSSLAGLSGQIGGGSHPGVAFEGQFGQDLLTEQFGPDPTGGGLGGALGGMAGGMASALMGGGGMAGMSSMGMGASMFGGDSFGGSSDFSSSDSEGEEEDEFAGRYVDDAAEYRTRAFSLQVRIHHERIPDLLAELTNSSFPVEIVRVDASFGQGGGGGGGGLGGMSMSGMGGLGGMAGLAGLSGLAGGGGGAMASMEMMGAGFGGGSMPGGRGGGRRSAPRSRRPSRSSAGAMAGLGGGQMAALGSSFGGIAGLESMGIMGGALGGMGGGRGPGGGLGALGGLSGDLLSRLASDNPNPLDAQKGQLMLDAALSDPNVVDLNIAGLLTVYRTKEENRNAEESAQAQELEVQQSGGVVLPEESPTETGVEPDTATENNSDGTEFEPTTDTDPAATTEETVSPAE